MRVLRYIGKRMLFIGPQLFGITLVSFFLVKLIPGDPAVMMLGPLATESTLAELRTEMGFDRTLPEQFFIYIKNIL